MNRGSCHDRGRETGSAAASMRPRFMNRGSTVTSAGTINAFLASMRPRFMNRGSGMDLFDPRCG